MSALTKIFWICFFILFYSYLGYPLLLFCLVKLKKLFLPETIKPSLSFQPGVALIIPAYNEQDFILAKIRNTMELDYPRHLLSVIFITDGSTDQTPALVRAHSNFKLLHKAERKGKSAAINRAIKTVTEPIIIFCDANTLLNKECITEMVKHYNDPKVGGVAGEKKILNISGNTPVSSGEGLYWKYESLIKKLDSQFYSVVGAAGELFSLRSHLYQTIEEDTIIEDFVLSLRICLKGFFVRYEPLAYAMETSSVSMKDEQKRKIRISAGAFQAMMMLTPLFNFIRFPILSFQFISHRVLRWTVCPLCLVLVFLCNLFLLDSSEHRLFAYLFLAQIVFYVLAGTGWILANRDIKTKLLYIPYYFMFMNFSVFIGFYRIVTKKQSVLWEKSAREVVH